MGLAVSPRTRVASPDEIHHPSSFHLPIPLARRRLWSRMIRATAANPRLQRSGHVRHDRPVTGRRDQGRSDGIFVLVLR